MTARTAGAAWLPASRVHDGDQAPAGVAVVCLLRNVATGCVRIGLANGTSKIVTGERPDAVVSGPR